jgi:N-methyl-L-tryptophan oxidase
MRNTKNKYDLVIIGAGIMGLFTAYWASLTTKKVLLIDKSTIGNASAASSGYTRSIRNDYIDPYYAALAWEATSLWRQLEINLNKKFIVNCGVLNIARSDVNPNLSNTYAQKSLTTLASMDFQTSVFKSQKALTIKYPQFDTNYGSLDIDAGLLDIEIITNALKSKLYSKGVDILENTEVVKVESTVAVELWTKGGTKYSADKLVITTGVWTPRFIRKVFKGKFVPPLPVIPVKQVVNYYQVPRGKKSLYSANNMPVFAYLDVGIYGHPIYKGSPGVKIAYFDPFGAKLNKQNLDPNKQNKIKNTKDFIQYCLPGLSGSKVIKSVYGYYQMTPDNDFIIDRLPGFENVFLATGFCGTGYKFAPVIGKMLVELAFRGRTVYDINRFSLNRFYTLSKTSMTKTFPSLFKYLKPTNFKYAKQGLTAYLASPN